MPNAENMSSDPFEAADDYIMRYECYAAGLVDEVPSIDTVPDAQRDDVLGYCQFLDWKYSDGLDKAAYRRPDDPEYFRSQFRIIQGGAEVSDS